MALILIILFAFCFVGGALWGLSESEKIQRTGSFVFLSSLIIICFVFMFAILSDIKRKREDIAAKPTYQLVLLLCDKGGCGAVISPTIYSWSGYEACNKDADFAQIMSKDKVVSAFCIRHTNTEQ